MSGCLWGQWHKFDDKTKGKLREFLMNLDKKENETESETWARIRKYKDGLYYHSTQTCKDINFLISEYDKLLYEANEGIAELKCARDSMIEVLEMAVPQAPANKTLILKTEGGEEIESLLIPKEEVESVLERYKS